MTPLTFNLGGEFNVNRLGFGAMRLTGGPGNFGPYPHWQDGIRLLRRAHELGISFFDSAWAYGPETADQILGEALGETDAVFATKGGVDKPQPGKIIVDGRPERLWAQIDAARKNLNRDRIDLFQLHRVDPDVPIEVSVAALAHAQDKGWIGHIGLSNVSLNDLERARKAAPIASVQNRFNMADQEASELVDFTYNAGIAFIPYGPLGAHPMEPGATLAPKDALAWLLRRSPNIIAIPGTTKLTHLEDNWTTWNEVARLDQHAA